MEIVRAGARPVFGIVVMAHGLSHLWMPMYAWMNPERLSHDFMPAILLGVAVGGFVAAGLGLLGARPLTAMVRPLMVLASAYSLIGMSRFGQGDLWWSGALDIVLFVTGLTAAYRFLPTHKAA